MQKRINNKPENSMGFNHHCRFTLYYAVFIVFIFISVKASADDKSGNSNDDRGFDFNMPGQNVISTNYLYFYISDGSFHNIKGITLFYPTLRPSQFIFNPSGASIARLNGKKDCIELISTKNNQLLQQIKDKRKGLPRDKAFSCISYTPDAKEMLVSNKLGEILTYSTSDWSVKGIVNLKKTYSQLKISPNLYYIAAVDSCNVDIWNKETAALRCSFTLPGKVRTVDFSNDTRLIAIAYEGGLDFIDAASMKSISDIALKDTVMECSFHPEGRFFAYISNNLKLTLYDLKKGSVFETVSFDRNGRKERTGSHIILVKADEAARIIDKDPYLSEQLKKQYRQTAASIQARAAELEEANYSSYSSNGYFDTYSSLDGTQNSTHNSSRIERLYVMISNSVNDTYPIKRNDLNFRTNPSNPKTYTNLIVSPDSTNLIGIDKQSIAIWNRFTSELIKTMKVPRYINSAAIINDASQMALSYNGGVDLIDLKNLNTLTSISIDEGLFNCRFLPTEAVHTGDATLVKKKDGSFSMVTTSSNKIFFWDIASILPQYSSIIEDDLNAAMDNWLKKAANESLNDYKIRVTDQSAAVKRAMLIEELATKIGMETVSLDNPFIGNKYNTKNHTIEITFKGATPFFMEMPESEAKELKNGQFSFSQIAFTINDYDELEFSHIAATNKATGKQYIYDNRQYTKMENVFAANDVSYVPIKVRQTIISEREKLIGQKDTIVERSRIQNLITGKTEISVHSEVCSDYDADGNKIYNYRINYKYVVSEGFSAQEDFAPGKFRMEESNAALTLLQTIQKAMSTELAPYLDKAGKVEISITGSADSKPVKMIPYNNTYGIFNNEPYYKKGILSSITVNNKANITNNEQLAFVRAVSASDWMSKNIKQIILNPDRFRFRYETDVAEHEGSEFRRINVCITITNAFK